MLPDASNDFQQLPHIAGKMPRLSALCAPDVYFSLDLFRAERLFCFFVSLHLKPLQIESVGHDLAMPFGHYEHFRAIFSPS
jgi:hypothetical protein